MAPSANMKLWAAVCETDPRHTKKVTQRGGFTAINAQYQIMRATEAFGPVGIGWGYDVDYQNQPVGNGLLVVADVVVWHGDRANTFGPVRTANFLVDEKGRVDDDAPKKAMTDGITKALSHLGFSADVFLGQYDDNKYLSSVAAKYGSEDRPVTPGAPNTRAAQGYQQPGGQPQGQQGGRPPAQPRGNGQPHASSNPGF